MPYKFSQELRAQLIAYFLQKYQVDISQELADEYLDSMADLYMAFSRLSVKE
jgi:hypothetical protein